MFKLRVIVDISISQRKVFDAMFYFLCYLAFCLNVGTIGANSECVPQEILKCVNSATSTWPKCDASQTKVDTFPTSNGRTQSDYGHYCTAEWADALNAMLSHSGVAKCNDMDAQIKMIAQVAVETGFFTTLSQPDDGAAGLLQIPPQHFVANAQDMDHWFGGGAGAPTVYEQRQAAAGAAFFKEPVDAWMSVAAWFKSTNRVMSGCNKDLWGESFDTQTECIAGQVEDRTNAFNIASQCFNDYTAKNLSFVIGHWKRTWSPKPSPRGLNMGIAFNGYSNPVNAKSESNIFLPRWVTKWISAGGGNRNGEWSEDWLNKWETEINNGGLQGWDGIAFDVEECAATGLANKFSTVLRAAKAKGFITMVSTSHAKPYGCSDAKALMEVFFANPDVDYLSPQLYTLSGEPCPDFSGGESSSVRWSDWVGAKGRFVPSLTCQAINNDGYVKTKEYFANLNINTAGYIVWGSDTCSVLRAEDFNVSRCTTTTTTMGSTTTNTGSTAANMGGTVVTTSSSECVSHATMLCINGVSNYWPKCDPSQSYKEDNFPAGSGRTAANYGRYCTKAWVDALNSMLKRVESCHWKDAQIKLLAQVAHESGYFTTNHNPENGGAGLVLIMPGNWSTNANDMQTLFGESYAFSGAAFFNDPTNAWMSVAAWYMSTNRIRDFPACGKNLFSESYETQTLCISGFEDDRTEAFNIVSDCFTSACMSDSDCATGQACERNKCSGSEDESSIATRLESLTLSTWVIALTSYVLL